MFLQISAPSDAITLTYGCTYVPQSRALSVQLAIVIPKHAVLKQSLMKLSYILWHGLQPVHTHTHTHTHTPFDGRWREVVLQ